jgi:hypothetical protein
MHCSVYTLFNLHRNLLNKLISTQYMNIMHVRRIEEYKPSGADS